MIANALYVSKYFVRLSLYLSVSDYQSVGTLSTRGWAEAGQGAASIPYHVYWLFAFVIWTFRLIQFCVSNLLLTLMKNEETLWPNFTLNEKLTSPLQNIITFKLTNSKENDFIRYSTKKISQKCTKQIIIE